MALNTDKFVENLILQGYSHLCTVPCSFAKNLINSVINNKNIEYLPCASEAVACSIAAGLKMSGKKPIVVVQSSGLTNMGSCMTSLLNPYDITFPILTSWRTYAEGDSEIQHKHLATGLPNLIESYGYEHAILTQENIKIALEQIKTSDQNHTVIIIKKDTFTHVSLSDEHQLNLSKYIPRSKFLKILNEKYKGTDTLFIGTTGNTAREMYTFMPDTNNFYMAGNMGGALSLGLGAAMAGKKVIVCGGDAEFVMHMGGLTTAGRYKNKLDLTYLVFDNQQNKSTGGQNTYQNHIEYTGIASNSGFNVEENIVKDISSLCNALDKNTNLNFICLKCGLDEETPRPPLNVVKRNTT